MCDNFQALLKSPKGSSTRYLFLLVAYLHVPSKTGGNKILYLFFFNCTDLTGDCLAPPELSAHISLSDLSAGLRMSLQILTASKLAGGTFLQGGLV